MGGCWSTKAPATRRRLASVLVLLGIGLGHGANAASANSVDTFLAHAIALRSGFVSAPEVVARHLTLLPNSSFNQDDEFLAVEQELWSRLMQGAVVKVGNLLSATPVVLYYNGLLDVAVLTVWERHPRRFELIALRALPGEALRRGAPAASLLADWRAADNPIAVLRKTTRASLAAFASRYPASSSRAIRPASSTSASRIEAQEAAEARLLAAQAERVATAGDPAFQQAAETFRRLSESGSASSPGLRTLAALPADVRASAQMLKAVPASDGGWVMFIAFPHYPRLLLVATANADRLRVQQLYLP